MHEKMAYQHAKIDEMESLLPGYVKQKVGQEMKAHLNDLDVRKLEVNEFDKAISSKIDKNAFLEVKKELFSQNNSLNLQIAEIASKFDLIKRDQDRTVSLDDFLRELKNIPKNERIESIEKLCKLMQD